MQLLHPGSPFFYLLLYNCYLSSTIRSFRSYGRGRSPLSLCSLVPPLRFHAVQGRDTFKATSRGFSMNEPMHIRQVLEELSLRNECLHLFDRKGSLLPLTDGLATVWQFFALDKSLRAAVGHHLRTCESCRCAWYHHRRMNLILFRREQTDENSEEARR